MIKECVRAYLAANGDFSGIEDTPLGKVIQQTCIGKDVLTVCNEMMPSGCSSLDFSVKLKSLDNKTESALLLLYQLFNDTDVELNGKNFSFDRVFWISNSKGKEFKDRADYATVPNIKRMAKDAIYNFPIEKGNKNRICNGTLQTAFRGKNLQDIPDRAWEIFKSFRACFAGVSSPYGVLLSVFEDCADKIINYTYAVGVTVNDILGIFGLKIPNLYACYVQYGMTFMILDDSFAFTFDDNGCLVRTDRANLAMQLKLGAVTKAGGF